MLSFIKKALLYSTLRLNFAQHEPIQRRTKEIVIIASKNIFTQASSIPQAISTTSTAEFQKACLTL